ncbi:hypothetical protein ACFE04_016213 [Oxalis oulophora]
MEKIRYPKVKIRVQQDKDDDDDDDDNRHGFKIGSLFTFKDIQSLMNTKHSTFSVSQIVLNRTCSQVAVKQPQDDPPSPVVRIPSNYVPSVLAMPRVSDLSVSEENKQIDDLEQSIIEASLSDKQVNGDNRSSTSTVSSNKTKQNDEDDRISIGDSSNKNKQIDDDEERVNIRATSILRPRAVLSSPVNDVVVGGKNKTNPPRTSALKSSNPLPNRHLQCRVVPSNTDNGSHIKTKKPKDSIGNESPINSKKPKEHIGNGSHVNTRKPKDNIGNESPIKSRKPKEHEHIGNKSPLNNTKKPNDVADHKSDVARTKVEPPFSIRSPGRYVKTTKAKPVWI